MGVNYMAMITPRRDAINRMTNSGSSVKPQVAGVQQQRNRNIVKKGLDVVSEKKKNQAKPTSMQALSELPDLISTLNEAVGELSENTKQSIRLQEQQTRQNDLVLTRIDGMAQELHALVILMSEMVTLQSYLMTPDTLDADSRSHREKVANLVKNGD